MLQQLQRILSWPLLFGALALPATYHLSRYGLFLISILVIALLGAVAGVMSARQRGSRSNAVAAFVSAAFLAELIMFGYYYIDYGHSDPKFGVGVAFSLIEFTAIALFGSFGVVVSHGMVRKQERTAQ